MKNRLKNSAGLQARIDMMKETCGSESKNLLESITSKMDKLKSFDIDVPADLPDDPRITGLVPDIADSVDTAYRKAKRESEKATEKAKKIRQSHAQHLANCTSQKQSLSTLEKRRDQLKREQQSVGKVKDMLTEMTDDGYEFDWKIEDSDPQDLLKFLETVLQDIEDKSPEEVPPKFLERVAKRIRKMVRTTPRSQDLRGGRFFF